MKRLNNPVLFDASDVTRPARVWIETFCRVRHLMRTCRHPPRAGVD